MSKTELIDGIVAINQSAERTFLDRFDEIALDEYLKHLLALQTTSAGSVSHGPALHPAAAPAEADNPQTLQAEAPSQTAVAVLDPPAEPDGFADLDESAEYTADDSRDVEDAPAADAQTHVFALVEFAAEENWQLPLFAARQMEQPATEQLAVNLPADLIAGDLPHAGQDAAPAETMVNEAHGMFCLDISDYDGDESIIDEFLRDPVSPEIAAILDEIKVDIGQSDPNRPAVVEIQQAQAGPAEPRVVEEALPAEVEQPAEEIMLAEEPQPVEEPVHREEPRTFEPITLPAIVSQAQSLLLLADVLKNDNHASLAEDCRPAAEISDPVETPLTQAGIEIDDAPPAEEDAAVPDEIPAAQEPIYQDEANQSDVEVAGEATAIDEADLPEAIEVEDSGAGAAVAASDEPDICML